MAASPNTCAKVLRAIVEAGCPVGRRTIHDRTGLHLATITASVQWLRKHGHIQKWGPDNGRNSALTVWEPVPGGDVVSPAGPGVVRAVTPSHPDAIWSGGLERSGAAPGLSSYAQRGTC